MLCQLMEVCEKKVLELCFKDKFSFGMRDSEYLWISEWRCLVLS